MTSAEHDPVDAVASADAADPATEYFPGANPHPVMRIDDDGRLIYANDASASILEELGVAVHERLPDGWWPRLRDTGEPVELKVGARTFELLPVRLERLGFTNVYGTDVTAARLVDKFPDLNPNPVMRVDTGGVIRYANDASSRLRAVMGCDIGDPLPSDVWGQLVPCLADQRGSREPLVVEVTDGRATFALTPIPLPEIDLINIYGRDITAEKAIVKFPDQNPNPVFRITWDGDVVYVNAAARPLLEGVGGSLGRQLPHALLEGLLHAVRAGRRDRVDVVSAGRAYDLLAVDVPEFGFINVYGTDVTAVRELEIAHGENTRLLLNILPEPIADRLRRGEALIADRHDDVSLLFADIVGFTGISSRMDPAELVTTLNDVFSVFDGLVEASGLEKVKTIGDAYMIVGGMPTWQPDHLERMASLALRLAAEVDQRAEARQLDVRFRIGIHTGPVVAGVIGTKKFIYDVWGDTVNVASRMESTGEPGRIQVSAAVESRLRGRFMLEPRGVIDVKGKGPMSTFFLVGEAV
jgi:class 3 adenylate cyclase